MKKKIIVDKNKKMDRLLGDIKKPEDVKPEEETKKEPTEIKLRGIDNIREYYRRFPGKNSQFTIYLPRELQNYVKFESIKQEIPVSEYYKNALIEKIIPEEELKRIYHTEYDLRNGITEEKENAKEDSKDKKDDKDKAKEENANK